MNSDSEAVSQPKAEPKPQANKKSQLKRALLILTSYLLTAAIVIGVVTGILYSIVVYNKSNSTEVQTEVQPTPSVNIVKKPDRATVRSNIAGYYKALSNSRIEQLGNYLEDPMQQWFSSTNISLSNVMADSRRYVEKYPFREANINWSTITFKELDGGLLQVTYVMDYRIKRKRLQFWSNYKLFITTVWNGDNKMVSMQEENLK